MCNARAVDIHHLVARGIGGTKCDNINEVPNLIALCRSCHIKAENNKEFNKQCKITHLKNMLSNMRYFSLPQLLVGIGKLGSLSNCQTF